MKLNKLLKVLLPTLTATTIAAPILTGCACNPEEDITVTFDPENGQEVTQVKVDKKTGKIAEPTAPTRTGYTFVGWYEQPECHLLFDFNNTKITRSMTIYAGWKDNGHIINLTNNVTSSRIKGNANTEYYILGGLYTNKSNEVRFYGINVKESEQEEEPIVPLFAKNAVELWINNVPCSYKAYEKPQTSVEFLPNSKIPENTKVMIRFKATINFDCKLRIDLHD